MRVWNNKEILQLWNQSVNHAYLYGNRYWSPRQFTPLETFHIDFNSEENKNQMNKRCKCAIKPIHAEQRKCEIKEKEKTKTWATSEMSWMKYNGNAAVGESSTSESSTWPSSLKAFQNHPPQKPLKTVKIWLTGSFIMNLFARLCHLNF